MRPHLNNIPVSSEVTCAVIGHYAASGEIAASCGVRVDMTPFDHHLLHEPDRPRHRVPAVRQHAAIFASRVVAKESSGSWLHFELIDKIDYLHEWVAILTDDLPGTSFKNARNQASAISHVTTTFDQPPPTPRFGSIGAESWHNHWQK